MFSLNFLKVSEYIWPKRTKQELVDHLLVYTTSTMFQHYPFILSEITRAEIQTATSQLCFSFMQFDMGSEVSFAQNLKI
jgi:hypothetical protein